MLVTPSKHLNNLSNAKDTLFKLVSSKLSITGKPSEHSYTTLEELRQFADNNDYTENLKDALLLTGELLDIVSEHRTEKHKAGLLDDDIFIEERPVSFWLNILWKVLFMCENKIKGVVYTEEDGYVNYPMDIFTETRRHRLLGTFNKLPIII